MAKINQDLGIEPLLIDGKDLAKLVNMTPRWVEINRHKIIGSQRVGGRWKFNLNMIRAAIASGKNIVI
jgi:hypothetical protein